MSLVVKIKEVVLAKRWYFLGGFVTILLAVGGFLGWNMYQHKQSPEFFLEEFNAAMTANDLAKLAGMVDFRGLTENMAEQIIRAPIPKRSDTQEKSHVIPFAEDIQRTFIKIMQSKGQSPAPAPPKDPLAPLEPFPVDFAEQISGKFHLQAVLNNQAVLSVKVHYPRLEKDYNLLFLMEKKPAWKIVRLNNMHEILRKYIAEEKQLEVLREEKFQKDNAEFQRRMDAQFNVESCVAFLHAPLPTHDSTLFVRVTGYNPGPHIIRNMTFETTITASTVNGDISIKRDLNMAARILPAANLEDSYTIDLDPETPQDMVLKNASKLSCTAKPRLMTLGNGELLFTRKYRLESVNAPK